MSRKNTVDESATVTALEIPEVPVPENEIPEDARSSAEKMAAYQRKWRESHPEKVAAYQAKWRAAHPQAVKEAHAKFQAANPDRVKLWHKRSQLKRNLLVLVGRKVNADAATQTQLDERIAAIDTEMAKIATQLEELKAAKANQTATTD